MKKIFGITIAMMLGLSMIGCEDTMDDTTIEEVEPTMEQQIEVEEETIEEENIEEPEEVVEEEIEEEIMEDIFNQDEFNYHMTTILTDEEYAEYFNSIQWIDDDLREIEFDGHILAVTPHEKYSTRCELMLGTGDYNNGEFTGPYIKTRDIAYMNLNGMINEGYNVRVKATIEEYDMDRCYLKINIKEIEAR